MRNNYAQIVIVGISEITLDASGVHGSSHLRARPGNSPSKTVRDGPKMNGLDLAEMSRLVLSAINYQFIYQSTNPCGM